MNRRFFSRLGALLLLFISSGCAVYSLVDDFRRVEIDGAYTVDPVIKWSRSSRGNVEEWTQDGPFLQELVFIKGIEDGEYVFKLPGQDTETTPHFDKNMTPPEIKDMLVASLKQIQAQDVEVISMTPETFGGYDGFRIEFSFATEDGVAKEGFLVGAVVDERLQAITYLGAKVHYFDKYSEHAEQVIRSVKFIDN